MDINSLGIHFLINIFYILSAFLFVFGLKRLSSPATSRQGNLLSALGMLIAIVAVLFSREIVTYQWIIAGLLVGTLAGTVMARRVAMTGMPEMVALLNGFGGASSLLVGLVSYQLTPHLSFFASITVVISVIIGGVTFTGSLVAWGKLSERLTGKPVLFKGQNIVNTLVLVSIVVLTILFAFSPGEYALYFYTVLGLSFVLGILSVIAIGGGDMPVVISLLNSYSGLAACAAGFVIHNVLLIVAGALVGASGIILTMIMCKAMNRSLSNVLFSGFGSTSASTTASGPQGEVVALKPEDAYYVLEAATSVVIVPGYGLAVAQAQHAVKELGALLEANGAEVRYAIHPVAGRMPGHMNVLLAEADVPYEQLVEMDSINPMMDSVDVCLVIGANDVVNPDAKDNPGSPIYGMPIIEVYRAKTVFVLKRSMNAGFAGIENPLFFKSNTRMIFGDAKTTVQSLVAQFKTP
jgi:NAD(P) transhydrogenase subunit beta